MLAGPPGDGMYEWVSWRAGFFVEVDDLGCDHGKLEKLGRERLLEQIEMAYSQRSGEPEIVCYWLYNSSPQTEDTDTVPRSEVKVTLGYCYQ